MVQGFRKQIIKQLQPFDILDDTLEGEVQLIYALGKRGANQPSSSLTVKRIAALTQHHVIEFEMYTRGAQLMSETDRIRVQAALDEVTTLATRLGVGESETHVRLSIDELRAAVGTGQDPGPAVERLIRSLEQLDTARQDGRRRDQRRGAPAVGQIRHAVHDHLLPAFFRHEND